VNQKGLPIKKWWDKIKLEYRKRTFFIRLEANCFRISLKHPRYIVNGLSVKYRFINAPEFSIIWQCELVYHVLDGTVLVYKYSDSWAKEFNRAVWEVNHG
jgi:hypothetical protein